ncbi:hypothetical protein J7E83_10695 [Arthrobacter sp. ISL-48]|uniref:N-acetylglucosamine kinase n=1 Tax=Arthrobacter sp. ISL-48 TaxID=2819110 RepID=UPI001BECFDB7|nr:BadF/BadG/BcrA/BcrD ATPase family protein [Arthrobacter sp. ISL-48]MBT2532578.1 hypothetical protein [Arthrobacter sp. ISL-48]
MQKILAVDAGGTTTRAAVIDASGLCLGYGTAGGGNPVSAGYDGALAAVAAAAEAAVAGSGLEHHTISSALVAMAGVTLRMRPAAIAQQLVALGLHGAVEIEADLLAMFHSGTHRSYGSVLIAGTGSVAARITDGRLDLVADGTGWLLGDTGSGYWIGHRVARAVVASLDGRGPPTALTALMLAELHMEVRPARLHGRPLVLLDLIDALYNLRPVELSRFAPLAFEAGGQDPVAARIVTAAASALAGTLDAVRDQQVQGPVVIGGSVARAVLAAPPAVAAPLHAALGHDEVIQVEDGLIGAAVLGLRRAGIPVDGDVFERLQKTVARFRDAARSATKKAPTK